MSRWTKAEILISEVVINCMLTSAAASVLNIRVATPVCSAIPSPTTETFETSSLTKVVFPPSDSTDDFTESIASSASSRGTVKLMLVLPSSETF